MKAYISSNSLLKWLDYLTRYVKELQEEAKTDNISELLGDGNHDGYIREFKSYLKGIVNELDISID